MGRHFGVLLPRLLLAVVIVAASALDSSEYLKYYRVSRHVATAKTLLAQNKVGDTSSRLAVMLLFSQDVANAEYGPSMKCSMELIAKNLQNSTPADLFLFVKPQHFQTIASRPWLQKMKNLFILTLDDADEASWKSPTWLRPPDKGWSLGFSEEYRLMGQWRLSFSFAFAKELGYKYLLQMDTDTYIKSPITYNLVEFMNKKQMFMTNRNSFSREVRDYHFGLAELAKFWLVTRRVVKSYEPLITAANYMNASGIRGPILKHCNPQNLDGLRTQDTGDSHDKNWVGWDAEIVAGHFNIFSLDWWFSWDVQDFVQLVLRTGGIFEHRWVDVSPQTMVNHLFCPEDKMHLHTDFEVDHGRGTTWAFKECGKDWMENLTMPSNTTYFPPL